jgi:hypothetical protein
MNTYVSDVANLIQIRAFINGMVDSMSVRLTREEVKAIQQKVGQMDRVILEKSLALDLALVADAPKVVKTFVSTEDTKTVLDKFRESTKQVEASVVSAEDSTRFAVVVPDPKTKAGGKKKPADTAKALEALLGGSKTDK